MPQSDDPRSPLDLNVDPVLTAFVENEVLPGLPLTADEVWTGLAALVAEFSARNTALLDRRKALQDKIDGWHRDNGRRPVDPAAYKAFLEAESYLLPEGADFEIQTGDTDPEIATIAGPQLVVPVTNARYALNAANARWGSLYDALYGSDAVGAPAVTDGIDPDHARRVIGWTREFLDTALPLASGSHKDQASYALTETGLMPAMADPAQLLGFTGPREAPASLVFCNNGLHIIVEFDANHPVAAFDPAGISDVRIESALSAIMDCEDSVATVDAMDKVAAYRNWLGLMRGDLTTRFTKQGREVTRRLAGDLDYSDLQGGTGTLKGRALMLVRNVGHLMRTPAILDGDGAEVYEGLLDAFMTVLIAMHDLPRRQNSVTGSVYVVKPKMHGPEEVGFADEVFSKVEAVLGLPQYTVKLGIMDEERRTSINLKACIRAAQHRVAFINTGFLDRTGDEIHTAMEAGPVLRKSEMKSASWLSAYEARNVQIGLACGLKGRAQIGKGMWAMPDLMADLLEQKIGHPKAGANCAWVPSPTAATLHATHYHHVDVAAVQADLSVSGQTPPVDLLLELPVALQPDWSAQDITAELENNCQGILGYVVRWVDQGVGCSTVPDINDVGLMEDRATCRISSQSVANWMHHGIVTEAEVSAALRRMAEVVDRQNAGDPAYTPMAPGFDGTAFRAAEALVLQGRAQPSGYTEPLLHVHRLLQKATA